jgi:hypothetical protein
MVNKKPRDLKISGFLLSLSSEEIGSNKRCVISIPLVLDFQWVRECEKIESGLLVEIFELSIASVVEKVPCS